MDKPSRKAAKAAARAQDRAAARAALPLPVAELRSLFEALDVGLAAAPCDHTLNQTLRWLAARDHAAATVVPWLTSHGGCCDCEVLANVEPHVDDALHERHER